MLTWHRDKARRGWNMKNETIAIHGGYETEPTTKAVAVPIYQTVAYEFDSADHGAALFNLEVEGYRYSRISTPTTAVLERRVAKLEGGIEALCVGSGQAALNYAVLNLAGIGNNIVSVPQLYGGSPRCGADRRDALKGVFSYTNCFHLST